MVVQTTYEAATPKLVAGLVVSQDTVTNVISRTVEDAAGIGFGLVVCQGANDRGIIKPAGGAAAYRGITVRSRTVDADAPDLYKQNDPNAEVMTKGVVAVTASVAVSAGDAAYFVDATGVITNVSTGNVAIPGGIFDADAGIGELVPLRIN